MIPPNEVPILRCVCKWFKEYIDSNDNLIAIQVFQLFFPKNIDFFCDFGENDNFIQERVKKNYLISHNTRNQSKWREFLKTYDDVRENFLTSNYKIFLISEELKQKQQNAEYNDPNSQKLQQSQKRLNIKLGGLQTLDVPELSDDDNSKGADLLGLGDACEQNLQDQQENVQIKFNQGEIDKEQIENQQEDLFKINKKKLNDSQDSENNSLDTENQDVFDFNTSKYNAKAQRISQISSKYIWSVLKDPPLPILKLRRENIGNHCNTWFQNKLTEVLYDGSKQIGFGLHLNNEEDKPLITLNDIIKNNKEYFIKEVKDSCEKWPAQKKDILNIRYYFYKKKPDYSFANRNNKNQLKRTSTAKLQTQKSILDKRSRGFSMVDEYYVQNSKVQQNSMTNFPSEPLPSQNPVVFNFFENKECNDTNQSNTQQDKNLNNQQKGMFDDIFQFIHNQADQDNDLQEEMEINNQIEEKNLFQTQELILTKQKPILLHFIESIIDLLIFKCQLVYEYLKEHMNIQNEQNIVKKNGFDILSEYSIMWNCYTASLSEIEDQLKDVFEIFNEAFDGVFEDYPQHPRMSIWRLMVKVWIQEIYLKDDLKEHLIGCFLKVLSIRRQENFQFQMKQIELDRKVQQQYYMPDQLEYISLTLLNNLTKNKNFSLLNYGEGYDYFHLFFSKNQYFIDSLLISFVENTIDLSLNEISIHYLGHSCIQMDSPYLQLEKQLLDSSQTYYTYQQNMFLQNPSNYLQFLKGDLKYVSKIFKERSQLLLRQRMLQHWKQMFKDIISSKIPKQSQLFNEKDEKAKSLIQQHVKQYMQQLKIQQQAFIQNEININSPLNLSQQNAQQQEGEDQVQQQQNQQQQQQTQVDNQDQPQIRQIGSKDIFPALIYKILEENDAKQKLELFNIELNSKSPSVDTQQLSHQQQNQITLNKNCHSVDGFLTEKKGIFTENILSGNQNNLNRIEEEDEYQHKIKEFSNLQLGNKKDTSTRTNYSYSQQNLSFEEQEKLQEKAHILAQMFRMSDDQMKTDIINYIEICRILQELETTKTDQDLEIEELNKARRLPISLNNEEQTFFFLTQSLNDDIIQETIQKQKEFMRQQRESNAERDSEEEINDNQQNQDEEDNNEQTQEGNNTLQFNQNGNQEDSDLGIPNSLSLKPNQRNQQINQKQFKTSANQVQDIPVYNSGEESDSQNYDQGNKEDRLFFNQKNQQSHQSDFSLGLDKELSRISNNAQFADNLNILQSDKNAIEFQFTINEPQEEQLFDPFKMEKQISGTPNNQMNMFTFKLQSNDTVNMKPLSQRKPDEEKNYFSSINPSISQNNNSSKNKNNNDVQLNFFSQCTNDNNKDMQNQQPNNNVNMFFNSLSNNNQEQSDEKDKDPFKMF